MIDETLVPAAIEAQFWRIDERLADFDCAIIWLAAGWLVCALAIAICAGVSIYFAFRLRRIEREVAALREHENEGTEK